MKKTVNTPKISSKNTRKFDESFRTIQKQPNLQTNLAEITPKEDSKRLNTETGSLLTLRNSSKFIENVQDFKIEIERKYKLSVINKIYSFPRKYDSFSEGSSYTSLKSVDIYDLDTQNYEARTLSSLKKSSKRRSQQGQTAKFDKEIERLTKEIDFYTNYANKTHEKPKDSPEKPKKMQTNEGFRGRKPHYVRLLKLLQEDNENEIKKSLSKSRTPSQSKNSKIARKDELSSQKKGFDKKFERIFENCCESKENLDTFYDFNNLSALRSNSRGKSKEKSRSPLKSKQENCRVLSPNGYSYMQNYLFDGEFKRESLKKIYNNSSLVRDSASKERSNNFAQNEEKTRNKNINSTNKNNRKLFLIHEKENINQRKKPAPDAKKKKIPAKKGNVSRF